MPQPLAPVANCPTELRITSSVPMVHVADVDASSVFYALLGFGCASRFSAPSGVTNWASLTTNSARIMLARASEPVDARQQAVLLYMYSTDVARLREHLLASGVKDGGRPVFEEGEESNPNPPLMSACFQITRPFYMPQGELRIHDPDGYVILVGQLEP